MKRKNYSDAFRTSVKVILLFCLIAIIIALVSKKQCEKKKTIVNKEKVLLSKRLDQYCAPLRAIKVNNELLPKKLLLKNDLRLKRLILITRHGLRGSYYKQVHEQKANCDLKNEFLFNKFFNEFDLDEQEMNVVHKYIHRADQINVDYANLNYSENPVVANKHRCVDRQLSLPGAVQLIILGHRLGIAYRDQIDIEAIEIASTDYLRVYQSAYALVYGMNSTLNEINLDEFKPDIRVVHALGSRMCIVEKYCGRCPKLDQLYEWSLRYYLDYYHRKLAKHERKVVNNLIQLLPKPEAADTYRHEPIELAMDGATTYACHYEKYEKFCDNNYCLRTVDIDLTVKLCDQMYKSIADDNNYLIYNLLVSKGFIEKLKLDLNEDDGKSVYLYSGNDITLIPLLHLLGIYDGKNPQLASRFIIELYQDSFDNKYVRVIYNGDDLTAMTRLCMDDNDDKKVNNCVHYLDDEQDKEFILIKLKNFLKFFNQLFIDVIKTDNFDNACRV